MRPGRCHWPTSSPSHRRQAHSYCSATRSNSSSRLQVLILLVPIVRHSPTCSDHLLPCRRIVDCSLKPHGACTLNSVSSRQKHSTTVGYIPSRTSQARSCARPPP